MIAGSRSRSSIYHRAPRSRRGRASPACGVSSLWPGARAEPAAARPGRSGPAVLPQLPAARRAVDADLLRGLGAAPPAVVEHCLQERRLVELQEPLVEGVFFFKQKTAYEIDM